MKINMDAVMDAFSGMIEANGSTVDVSLPEGIYFQIKASDVNRLPANLTDGIQQDRNVIRVMGDQWHKFAGADRRPEKGDRITVAGVRHAVDTARPAQFQDRLVGYVITLRG